MEEKIAVKILVMPIYPQRWGGPYGNCQVHLLELSLESQAFVLFDMLAAENRGSYWVFTNRTNEPLEVSLRVGEGKLNSVDKS